MSPLDRLDRARDRGWITLSRYLEEVEKLGAKSSSAPSSAHGSPAGARDAAVVGADEQQEGGASEDDEEGLVDEDGRPWRPAKQPRASDEEALDDVAFLDQSYSPYKGLGQREGESEGEGSPSSSRAAADSRKGESECDEESDDDKVPVSFKAGDVVHAEGKGRAVVVRMGVAEDYFNEGRVYIQYEKLRKGCVKKMDTVKVWVVKADLRLEVEADEAPEPPPRSSPRRAPPGRDEQSPAAQQQQPPADPRLQPEAQAELAAIERQRKMPLPSHSRRTARRVSASSRCSRACLTRSSARPLQTPCRQRSCSATTTAALAKKCARLT